MRQIRGSLIIDLFEWEKCRKRFGCAPNITFNRRVKVKYVFYYGAKYFTSLIEGE